MKLISGLAVLVITQLLLFSAWLSASPRAWMYYLWTAIAVLLWAQPWSRRDPYRTIPAGARAWTYALLAFILIASAFFFDTISPLLILLEVVVLFALDFTGQRSISKSRL